ncbi:hypothetical protein [Streptomyces sp. CB01580]|uniref:hypothetical protein n=1 Tax=Streptomyces sp. CB01580 TaxID=1703933 RepID=UPI00093DEAF6|nr:hypothetical protein [Streptomyces sp. CB01580]
MDRSFRLRDEDSADYAAVLDEVIESAEIQRLLTRSPLGAGELRVKGLAAAPRVAAAAEAEYRSYAELRQRSHRSDDVRTDRTTSPSGPGRQERTGAGLVPVVAVLTPVLAAVAAATFLLLGYGLRLTDSLSTTADTLVHAGWISLATAASTGVIGLVALYRTAAEHKESTAGGRAAPSGDLRRAREAWLEALRDVGIRPFLVARLQEAHADPDPGPRAGSGHRPRFSSPDFGRPRFSSPDFGRPDFSSPDFAGPGSSDPDPEGPTPDGRGPDSQDFIRPEFSRPDFGRPDFSSPDFAGPSGSDPDPEGPTPDGRGPDSQDFIRPEFSRPDFRGPDFSGPDFSGPGLPDTRR